MQTADRLVVSTVRRGGRWLTVLVVASVGGAGCELALPFVLGGTVDALISDAPEGRARLAACVALVVGVVACETFVVWAAGAGSAQASTWLRSRIAGQVLGVGPGMTRRFAEGDLVTRLGLNAEEVGRAPETVVTAVTLLLPTVGSLVALTLIDPWLALTLVAGLVLIGIVLRAFLRDTTTIAGGYQQAQGDLAARLVDALSGARTIAAAGTADTEARRVLTPLSRLRAHGLSLWRANARAGVQVGLAAPLLEVAVLGVGGLRLASGSLTIGELYAAARYAVLGAGLSAALGNVGRLARARSAAERVAELLAEPPVKHGPRTLPAGPGTLEFRGVVLSGHTSVIDAVLPGGSVTAVVGRSGAGKSLFATLAGRLADPVQGTVLLDDVPLPELSRQSLRRAIGYAPERPVLVGDTIADVIGLGCPPGSDTVRASARAACVDDFIRPLPRGYATPLAEAPMSGGERQRIGLARAFAQGERLLILDDATSSLDTVTEHQINAALTGELRGRTRLIVAHRAAIAARADRVLWLEDGRLRACDQHRVLWQDPDYRGVFQLTPDPAVPAEGAAG